MKRKEHLEEAPGVKLKAGQKRKYSDVHEADPKLKEFLEVMQPASKVNTWDPQQGDDSTNEPPTKIQAIELPEGESDEEYEAVPKKSRKKSPERRIPTEPKPAVSEPVAAAEEKNPVTEPVAPDATDDDWLRGRTNRLLDLMDPDDIPVGQEAPASKDADPVADPVAESNLDVPKSDNLEEAPEAEEEWEGIDDETPEPVIEAIKSNGRLFVRNLPYSATEDDLREHFAPYGALNEVQVSPCSFPRALYDEYPDRDSLCLRHMMLTGRIF